MLLSMGPGKTPGESILVWAVDRPSAAFTLYLIAAFAAHAVRTECALSIRGGRLGRHMDQGAGTGVFQHPQRAIGTFFDIAEAVSYIPALGGFGAAVAVKDDSVQRHGPQAANKSVAVPLWEGLCAVIEHQIAGRYNRRPIDHRLGQVGPCVGPRDGHAVVVLAIGDQRPAIVLSRLDQVQLIAAERAMLDLPQFARGRERQAIGRADAAGPGFSRRQISAWERIGAHHRRSFRGFGVFGRIDQRNRFRARFAEVRIAWGRFAVQRQPQDLAFRLVWILSWQ